MVNLFLQKILDSEKGKMQLNVEMNIQQGSLVALYGDSGAGKTSILRMLSGLMKVDQGIITVNEQNWLNTKKNIDLKPQHRNVGFLFQDYALFPNMTVRENLLYALEKGQDSKIVDDLISLIELKDLQNQKPENLSGGQKQRVALARTLVRKPKVLLLDEPFSALDLKMRVRLQDYLLRVHLQYHLTTIFVSHNISEIVKIADQIFVLDNGLIKEEGKPIEVFTKKHTKAKFQFPGEVIQIKKEGIIYIVTVLVGKHFVKIVTTESDINTISAGDTVFVGSENYNLSIQKIN